jgi:hypothetical protein
MRFADEHTRNPMSRRAAKILMFWVMSILISCLLPVLGYQIGKAGDC